VTILSLSDSVCFRFLELCRKQIGLDRLLHFLSNNHSLAFVVKTLWRYTNVYYLIIIVVVIHVRNNSGRK